MNSVVSTGTEARSSTTLTLDFVTPDSTDNANKLNYVGVEVPWGWGNFRNLELGKVTP